MANATSSTASQSKTPIIAGTLGHSDLISAVVNSTKLDVSTISGKWESFIAQQVSNPLPGVDKAYVIIGSDKRGKRSAHSQNGPSLIFPKVRSTVYTN